MISIARSVLPAVVLLSVLDDISLAQQVHGDLRQWHRVVIDFQGPPMSESADPNPFTDYLAIRWDGPGPFTVQIFNARGRVVDVLEGGEFSSQTKVWRPSQSRLPLSPGLYFVRVRAPGLEEIRRAIYLK